ncbi:MAG: hypothetical protein JRF47_16165 [Deltaproteobacteria bacterium]|nr:hypothetical protein [Deltaproteobacteria bacterium]
MKFQMKIFIIKSKLAGLMWRSVALTLFTGTLVIAFTFSAEAVTFDFLNGTVTEFPNAISMTNGAVTATATAYQVEFSESSSTIYGPFTTGDGDIFEEQVFGKCVRGFCDTGLGLGSWQNLGQTDTDRGTSISAPGFDNTSMPSSSNPLPSVQFALFRFSTPVDLSQVIVDGVSSFKRGIWVAAGNSAPDLSTDFLSAFAGYTVLNSPNAPIGNPRIHLFDTVLNVTYIAIGTPTPESVGDIGPFLTGDRTQFYFNELNVTPVPSACEGDIHPLGGDGDVDGSDLAVFAADFERTDCP